MLAASAKYDTFSVVLRTIKYQVTKSPRICYIFLKKYMQFFFYQQADQAAAGVLYDKEFIVCSLDLLSGLAEGLGGGIESLVWFFLYYFCIVTIYLVVAFDCTVINEHCGYYFCRLQKPI